MNNQAMNTMDTIDEGLMDSFVPTEELDVNEEKLKEINKTLPKWSLEPPEGFLK